MPVIDNDALIRDRAYEIWERAGRPVGLEHEHWAKARREVEAAQSGPAVSNTAPGSIDVLAGVQTPFEPLEANRLRQALYAPEPFSFELFGKECPGVDRPIVLGARDRHSEATRAAA